MSSEDSFLFDKSRMAVHVVLPLQFNIVALCVAAVTIFAPPRLRVIYGY